jgi:hypothetical protein
LLDREHFPPNYENPKETLDHVRDVLNSVAAGAIPDPKDKDPLQKLKESFKKGDYDEFAKGVGQAFKESGTKLVEGVKNGDLVAVAVSTAEISTLITITGACLLYEGISALNYPQNNTTNNSTGG